MKKVDELVRDVIQDIRECNQANTRYSIESIISRITDAQKTIATCTKRIVENREALKKISIQEIEDKDILG